MLMKNPALYNKPQSKDIYAIFVSLHIVIGKAVPSLNAPRVRVQNWAEDIGWVLPCRNEELLLLDQLVHWPHRFLTDLTLGGPLLELVVGNVTTPHSLVVTPHVGRISCYRTTEGVVVMFAGSLLEQNLEVYQMASLVVVGKVGIVASQGCMAKRRVVLWASPGMRFEDLRSGFSRRSPAWSATNALVRSYYLEDRKGVSQQDAVEAAVAAAVVVAVAAAAVVVVE